MDLERLIALSRRRWSVPIIAQLHRADGDRFVTLTRKLEASPEAVRQTLAELMEMGLVEPNPGYGHPLRPEYILTKRGDSVAPACVRLDDALADAGLRDVCLRRWALPSMYVIGDGVARFSEIGRALGDVTDRALSLTLSSLDSAAVVARRLMDARPPRYSYLLAGPGPEIHGILRGS